MNTEKCPSSDWLTWIHCLKGRKMQHCQDDWLSHTQEAVVLIEPAVFFVQMNARNQAWWCDSFPGYVVRPEMCGLIKLGQKVTLKDFTGTRGVKKLFFFTFLQAALSSFNETITAPVWLFPSTTWHPAVGQKDSSSVQSDDYFDNGFGNTK